MQSSVIELTEVEQLLCHHIASARHAACRKVGMVNARIGDQSDLMTDLNGFGAELAFCKLFNLFPDMLILPRKASDDTGDAVLWGKRVDVKTTVYPNGRLLAAKWKQHVVDLYALMIGEFPRFELKGFMSSEELLVPARLGNLGHGEGYIAGQADLKPITAYFNFK